MATAALWPREVGAERTAVRLRVATAADAVRLAELHAASGSPRTAADLSVWLTKGGALIVEREGGHVLAAVCWRPNQHGWEVERVTTRPEERGNGYGRWLMTKLEALAIRGNVPHLELSLEGPDAVPYYARMGYRPTEGSSFRLSKRVGGVWQRQVGS